MATTSSREARDRPFYRVRGLASKLVRHPSSYLSDDDLAMMGIEVVAMDIKTGTPADSGPQFCDLYPFREFDAMFETVPVQWPPVKKRGVYYAALQIMQIIESSLLDGGLASHSKYVWRSLQPNNGTPFELLNCVVRRHEPLCYGKGTFNTLDPSIPHLGTLLIDGAVADDRLRRSEVCWAAFLMAGRLREEQYRAHGIVPAFVYSISGRNARVIQAHYENGKFIIRKTEYISFEKKNIDGYKLFLRWIMNIPKGETIRAPPVADYLEVDMYCTGPLRNGHIIHGKEMDTGHPASRLPNSGGGLKSQVSKELNGEDYGRSKADREKPMVSPGERV